MLNLIDELRYVNKEKIEQTTELALNNSKILEELIGISIGDDEYISQHASLIVHAIVKKDNKIILPYIDDIISILPKLTNNSQLGNFIEMLEQIAVDCSEIYKFCFNLITDNNRPGFVKIYSVKMLGVAAKKDSNLKKILTEFIKEKYDSLGSSYLKKEALIVLENIK